MHGAPANTLVYRSGDFGKTWGNRKLPGVLPNIYPPNNMTSTSHGLYIARCQAGYPKLWFSPDGAKDFRMFQVPYKVGSEPVKCGNVTSDDVLGHFRLVYPGVTLARGPDLSDTGLALGAIRVAYPSLETATFHGLTFKRSVLRVVNVYVPLEPAGAHPIL